MKTISQQFEDTINELSSRGFSVESSEIAQIKDAIRQDILYADRFSRPSFNSDILTQKRQLPCENFFDDSNLGTPYLDSQEGEESLNDYNDTCKSLDKKFQEAYRVCPMELNEAIHSINGVPHYTTNPDAMLNVIRKASQEVKDVIKEAFNVVFTKHKINIRSASYKLRLASLSADGHGYKAVAKNLMNSSDKLSKVEEKHGVFSIESIFEGANDIKDFWGDLEKFTRAMGDVYNILRVFDDKYRVTVLSRFEKNEIGEEEAVKETLKSVRKADKEIQSKIRGTNL